MMLFNMSILPLTVSFIPSLNSCITSVMSWLRSRICCCWSCGCCRGLILGLGDFRGFPPVASLNDAPLPRQMQLGFLWRNLRQRECGGASVANAEVRRAPCQGEVYTQIVTQAQTHTTVQQHTHAKSRTQTHHVKKEIQRIQREHRENTKENKKRTQRDERSEGRAGERATFSHLTSNSFSCSSPASSFSPASSSVSSLFGHLIIISLCIKCHSPALILNLMPKILAARSKCISVLWQP